jgi:hypothetical protein
MPEKNLLLCINTQRSAGYDQPISGSLAAKNARGTFYTSLKTPLLHSFEPPGTTILGSGSLFTDKLTRRLKQV